MSRVVEKIQARAVSTFLSKGSYPEQEDSVLVDREKGVFIVADGFGGPIAGTQASQNACVAVRNFLFKQAGDREATLPFVLRSYFSLAGNVLFNALIHANQKLNQLNLGKTINEKGGTSLLAGLIDGNLLAIASVGVCSAWLIRDGQETELVIPRSFSRLTDPFQLSSLEGLNAPLTALGMAEDLEPEIFEYRIQSGDWLFFGSDGIPASTRKTLLTLSRNPGTPESCIQNGTELLNRSSYRDNVCAALVLI